MYLNKKIGIGIPTYERPEYLRTALSSVADKLSGVVDYLIVCDDASEVHGDEIQQILNEFNFNFEYEYIINDTNKSVAVTKNNCLKKILDKNCDYIFLMENDMQVIDEKAVTGYIDVSIKSGVQHFNYAHHSPMNTSPLAASDLTGIGEFDLVVDGIDVFTACCGSYSFYTKQCIEEVGLMDEALCHNSWEHLEHTLRCAKQNFTFKFWRFADASGSINWVTSQQQALESSTIRNSNPNWFSDMEKSKEYVMNKHPGFHV